MNPERHVYTVKNRMVKSALNAARVACVFALAVGSVSSHAQSSLDEKFVVIKAGTVITVSGDEIAEGMIVIVDGKIRLVGTKLEYPANATVIDATDEVVMPGMIHLGTRSGIPSYGRSGIQTHRNVTDEVYLNELDFDPFLRDGFTAVCLTPPGSGMPGMSAVYRTGGSQDGEDASENRLLSGEAFLPVSFENPGQHKPALRNALKKAQTEIDKVDKARKEWDEKQKKAAAEKKKTEGQKEKKNDQKPKEGEKKPVGKDEKSKENGKKPSPEEFKPPEIDPGHKRLADQIQDTASYPMILKVRNASSILHAVDVIDDYEQIDWIWHLQSNFRADFNYAAERLGERSANVMLIPSMHSMPSTTERYNLAADLIRHGCTIAFIPGQTRTYRNQIAQVVRAGLSRDKALEAMTINPARFLGLEEKLGTIEKDKEADLIFLDGDPIDPATHVTRVMILGEIVWEEENE